MFDLKFSKESLLIAEIFIMVLCVFIILLGMWSIDVGASGMLVEAQTGVEIMAGNGYMFQSACKQYHNGIYLVFVGFLLLCALIAVTIVDKYKGHKEETGKGS